MHVIRATQQMLETRTLVIGFQGENLRTQLRVDCSPTFAEYPNATPALAIKPPTGETYPVFVERDGTEVIWNIVANNLVLKGDGELQLTFYKGDVIAKTSIGHITVNRSLQIDGEMPDVVATWIENANRKLAEVDAQIVELEGMVDTATDAATRAEQSASTASAKAEQAAGSAATATAKATEATNAAGTATAKAAEAELSATQAGNSAVSAADSERGAIQKATEAAQSAQTATAKAEQATEAAQTATEKAADASASATAAHSSEINAAESADDALSAEVGANAAKRAAETSATQASISEQNAGIAAQTATQKAAEATQSATNAETFAGTATTKAEEAAASAQAAQEAKTAVEETAEQLADSLEQIEQNTHDIAEHEQYAEATYAKKTDLYKKADIIHSTASGAIASFPDGAEMPVDEVTAQINPVQDLHGYSNPWPGGGGENILDPNIKFTTQTVRGVTLTTTDGYNFSISGTGESGSGNIQTNTIPVADCIIYPAGTYTVTGMIIGTYHTDGSWYSNRGGTFTSPEDFIIRNGYREIAIGTTYNVNDFISMAKGTTAPTEWTPYANICPITGFTKAKIWDDPAYCGTIKWNQLSKASFNLPYVHNGVTWVRSADGDSVTASGVVAGYSNSYVQLTGNSGAVVGHKYYVCSGSKTGKVLIWYNGSGGIMPCVESIGTITALAQGFYLRVNGEGVSVEETVKPQIFDLTEMFGSGNEPSTVEDFKALFPADYYPFDDSYAETCVSAVNGNPYRQVEVEFPTEAGTVYGGSLTIADDGSGVLTVDREVINAKTITTWTTGNVSGQKVFTCNHDASKVDGKRTIWCNYFKPIVSQYFNPSPDVTITNAWARWSNINVRYDALETLADWKSFINENDVQIGWYITPITYTLTASQITTLLGENHLWHDANGDISVDYKADTKLYIDNKIAELVASIVNS